MRGTSSPGVRSTTGRLAAHLLMSTRLLVIKADGFVLVWYGSTPTRARYGW